MFRSATGTGWSSRRFPMRRRVSVSILIGLIGLSASLVCWRCLIPHTGASLLPLRAADRLLAHKFWHYDFHIPKGYSDTHFVGLQIRRAQLKGADRDRDPWVSIENTDAMLASGAIGLRGESEEGEVAIQIVNNGHNLDSFQFLGGLLKGGTSSKLGMDSGFLIGELTSMTTNRRPEWVGNELHLLRVYSTAGSSKHVYDVILEIRDKPLCR